MPETIEANRSFVSSHIALPQPSLITDWALLFFERRLEMVMLSASYTDLSSSSNLDSAFLFPDRMKAFVCIAAISIKCTGTNVCARSKRKQFSHRCFETQCAHPEAMFLLYQGLLRPDAHTCWQFPDFCHWSLSLVQLAQWLPSGLHIRAVCRQRRCPQYPKIKRIMFESLTHFLLERVSAQKGGWQPAQCREPRLKDNIAKW